MKPDDFQQRFTEAAVRPLAHNAEDMLVARDFVARFAISDDKAALEGAVRRWEEKDAVKHPRFWKHLPSVLALLALFVMGAAQTPESVRQLQLIQLLDWDLFESRDASRIDAIVSGVLEKLPPGQRLLFHDPAETDSISRAEKLWKTEPENPAYFAEYATAWISAHDSLPPGYEETAARLAPNNAYFTYLAAKVTGENSVKPIPRKTKDAGGAKVAEGPKTWTISDPGKLDNSLVLLRQARRQPEFNTYGMEMSEKRLASIREASLTEKLEEASLFFHTTSSIGSFHMRRVSDLLSAKAWELAEEGDVTGFLEISKDTDHFLHGISSTAPGLVIDEMVSLPIIANLSESLAQAAEKLGQENQAARWQAVLQRAQANRISRLSRSLVVDGRMVREDTKPGGMIGSGLNILAQQADQQPKITDADLKPGRMLDHEIFSNLSVQALSLLVAGLMGLFTLYRYRTARVPRGVARRMVELLGTRDWLWIFGAGIVAPFACVMAINRFTPFGGHDFGAEDTGLLLPAGHFVAVLLLWLSVPASIIRWRLAKSARAFGVPLPAWFAWLHIATAAAFIPAISWMGISRSWQNLPGHFGSWPPHFSREDIPWCLAVLILLSSLLGASISIFSDLWISSTKQLHRAAVSMAMVNALACGLILLALSTFAFRAGEQAWFAREKLWSNEPGAKGYSRYEYLVAIQMRKEFLEILGDEGSADRSPDSRTE